MIAYDRGSKSSTSHSIPSVDILDTFENVFSKARALEVSSETSTYIEVSIPIDKYTVSNGYLVYGSSTATDYLSPMLFTSLNDLIIDNIINESNGAVAVNTLPAGSLLLVGDTYFMADGADTENKVFVGYAKVDPNISVPSLPDIAKSFSSQMIRAGSQYLNVSHFFDERFTILGRADYNSYSDKFSQISKETLTSDSTDKYVIFNNGDYENFVEVDGVDAILSFAPVKFGLQNGLLAVRTSDPSVTPAKYRLCNTASTALDGCFDDLPFLTDNTIDTNTINIAPDVNIVGFQKLYNADRVKEDTELAQNKQFTHDLGKLVFKLLFLVVFWLLIASWLCYGSKLLNLTPILDSIKNPSKGSAAIGFDLLQIISLGTIKLETEFTLGRFIQYNAILCVIMFVLRSAFFYLY